MPSSNTPPQHKKLTQKEEMFCRLVMLGRATTEAYRLAGYATDNENWGNPWRIRDKPHIALRIKALREEAAKEHNVTVGQLIAELDTAREHAIAEGDPAAEIAAVLAKAKLLGFLVDKAELTVTRKPTFIPTDLTQVTEAEWEEMVGIKTTNGHGGQH